METRGALDTAKENTDWYNHYRKQYESSQKFETRNSIQSYHPRSGYLPREDKTPIQRGIHATNSFSLQHSLQSPRAGNNLPVRQQVTG